MSYDSEQQPHPDPSPTAHSFVTNDNTIAPGDKPKRSKHLREVEAEGLYLWQISKHYLNHPAAAGGLLGIINIGLVVFAGRKFYRYPHLRRDATAISASFAACIVFIATEGYIATKYRQTVQLDQEGEQKAKKGGSVIFRRLNKHIGSHGAIAGLVNTFILGTIGYWSYLNWNKPWDGRAVSAISVGFLALEGFLAKRYRSGRDT